MIYQYNINNISSITTTTFSNKLVKIGISISEDDYFSYRPNPQKNDPYLSLGNEGFSFTLNNQEIYLGLTDMYESDTFLESPVLELPEHCPNSILIQIETKEINGENGDN